MPSIRTALAAIYTFLGTSVLKSQGSPLGIELRIPLASTPLSVDELIFNSTLIRSRLGVDGAEADRIARRRQLAFSRRVNSIPSGTGVIFDTTFRSERLDDVIADIFARASIFGLPDDASAVLARMQKHKRAFDASKRLAIIDELDNMPEYWPAGYVPPLDDMVDDLAWIPVRLNAEQINGLVEKADPRLREHFESLAGPESDALDDGSVASVGLEYLILQITREWPVGEIVDSEFWNLDGPRLASEPPAAEDRLPSRVEAVLLARRLDVEFDSVDAEPDPVPKIVTMGVFGTAVRGVVLAQKFEAAGGTIGRPTGAEPKNDPIDRIQTSIAIQAAGASIDERVAESTQLLEDLVRQLGEMELQRDQLQSANIAAAKELERRRPDLERQTAAVMAAQLQVKTPGLSLSPFGNSSRRNKAAQAKLKEVLGKRDSTSRSIARLEATIKASQSKIERLKQTERETRSQIDATESTVRALEEIDASIGDAEMYEVAYFCRRTPTSPNPGNGFSRIGTFGAI